MAKSPKSSTKSDAAEAPQAPKQDKSEGEKQDNVIRISRQHTSSFYIRAGTQFLQGVTDKNGVEKKVFDEIVISALGAAIATAAQVAGILERNEVGTIVKCQTAYTALEYGRRPQVLITVRRNPSYVPSERELAKGKGKKGNKKDPFASDKDRHTKDAPKTPEELLNPKKEKKLAKVKKEGGKRGVEIEGSADMGGLKYFCTRVLEPAGDLDLLVESVKAMNAFSDPTEEERKGGSGSLGKIVMSMADDNNLCVCSYVPYDNTDELAADEWLTKTLVKCSMPENCIKLREDSNKVYSQICVKNDANNGIFCLKLRDYVIQFANSILIERNLLPEPESSDDECYWEEPM